MLRKYVCGRVVKSIRLLDSFVGVKQGEILSPLLLILFLNDLEDDLRVKTYIAAFGIEDIYFFEVNTKYISSSAVKKISIFHECVARVKMLIFSPQEMKYILYLL